MSFILTILDSMPGTMTLRMTDFDISVNATYSKPFAMLDASSESMLLVPRIIPYSMLLGNAKFFAF